MALQVVCLSGVERVCRPVSYLYRIAACIYFHPFIRLFSLAVYTTEGVRKRR